jgi:hypothetical protein
VAKELLSKKRSGGKSLTAKDRSFLVAKMSYGRAHRATWLMAGKKRSITFAGFLNCPGDIKVMNIIY